MKFRDYRKPKSRADSVYASISKFNLCIEKKSFVKAIFLHMSENCCTFAAEIKMFYESKTIRQMGWWKITTH